MALTKDALERALNQYKTQPVPTAGGAFSTTSNPTLRTQPVSGGSTYSDVSKQPVGTQTPYKAPTATYQPGEGSQINYGEQKYANGVQASPTIGQADLPKYENVDQFDFNRNYEDTLDQLQRQRADLEQQNDLGIQRLQEDYGRRFRDIKQKQEDALNLQNERMAGNGILRSGIAVRESGAVGGQFGNLLDEQQRALSEQIENQNAQFAQQQRQIQEQIGKAQEYLTRQQQELEEQRARQAAAAAAAQRAAFDAGNIAQQKKPTMNVVKDNLGKYFIVDPTNMTRQQVDQNQLSELDSMYQTNLYADLNSASQLFGKDYVANANALARRLGGNLGGKASLDVRLGFKDLGKWGS